MNPHNVGEVFAIILVVVVGILLLLSILSARHNKHKNQSSEETQLDALTNWLVTRIMSESNRSHPLDKMAKNRVRGAAVKAFYHLKRNQAVTIQLPQLYMGDQGLADFQVSITREQLHQICFGFI